MSTEYPWLFVKLNYILRIIIGIKEKFLDGLKYEDYINEFVRWALVISAIHKNSEFPPNVFPKALRGNDFDYLTKVEYVNDEFLYKTNRDIMSRLSTLQEGKYYDAIRFFSDSVSKTCYEAMVKAKRNIEEYVFSTGVVCMMYDSFISGNPNQIMEVFPLFAFILYRATPRFPKDGYLHMNKSVFSLIPSGRGSSFDNFISDIEYRELFIGVFKSIKTRNSLDTLRAVKNKWLSILEKREREDDFSYSVTHEEYLRIAESETVSPEDWKKSLLSSVLGKGTSMAPILKIVKVLYSEKVPHFNTFINSLFYSTVFNLYHCPPLFFDTF